MYKLFKLYQLLTGLYKRVNNLGNEVTRESIDDFISYINARYEPTRFYAYDFIRLYKLINVEQIIVDELKLRVKKVILSKGILVD